MHRTKETDGDLEICNIQENIYTKTCFIILEHQEEVHNVVQQKVCTDENEEIPELTFKNLRQPIPQIPYNTRIELYSFEWLAAPQEEIVPLNKNKTWKLV